MRRCCHARKQAKSAEMLRGEACNIKGLERFSNGS